MDAIVCGSVAVTRDGRRCGKGEGYSDLEYAILRELGHPPAPVATTVHPVQILRQLPRDPTDLPLSLIVTPHEVIRVASPPPAPAGIDWARLSEEDLDAMPVLRELARPGSRLNGCGNACEARGGCVACASRGHGWLGRAGPTSRASGSALTGTQPLEDQDHSAGERDRCRLAAQIAAAAPSSPNDEPRVGQSPNPRSIIQDTPTRLALPPACWFEGQLQLILTVTLQQVCHSPTYEPGERHTVFFGERRQLLVVPLVDADRDPRCKSLPPPGSHRSLSSQALHQCGEARCTLLHHDAARQALLGRPRKSTTALLA